MKPDQQSRSLENVLDWIALESLIKTGQYRQAADLLESEYSRQQGEGNRVLSEFLAAARQICLACHQSRAEKDWHRRAEIEAEGREEEMKHQLHSLLEMLSGESNNPGTGRRFPDQSGKGSQTGGQGLLKLLQNLLTYRNFSLSPPDSPADLVAIESFESSSIDTGEAAALRIYCFGPFRVHTNGGLISEWQSLKGKSIFKYLAIHYDTPVSRDILMETFWPESDPECARRNLHQAIYSLRQTLRLKLTGNKPILFEDDHYRINPDLSIWIDFDEFERRIELARNFSAAGRSGEAIDEYLRAEELYQGDFLDEDLYENWVENKRLHLKDAYFDLADRLSSHYVEQKNFNRAIEICRSMIEKDDCFETAHRRLMECYQAIGQPALAVRQYHLCAKKLHEELDVTPSSQTRSLFETLTASGRNLGLAAKSGS